jgi:thiol-disulfide isomerase/thioredoxin
MIFAASTPKPFVFASKKRVLLRMFNIFALIVLVLLSASGSGIASSDIQERAKDVFTNFDRARTTDDVPSVQFLAGDGSKRSLNDYRGKGIVLNFWATWCAPCVREMPQLDRLSALVKGNGIEVLTISEDRKGQELAPKFYKQNGLNDLPVLVDVKSGLSRALKVKGLPTTVLIDSHGKEIGRILGIAEWDSSEIVGFVREHMSPNP